MTTWAVYTVPEPGNTAIKVADVDAATGYEAAVLYLVNQQQGLPAKIMVVGKTPAMTHRTAVLYAVEDGNLVPDAF